MVEGFARVIALRCDFGGIVRVVEWVTYCKVVHLTSALFAHVFCVEKHIQIVLGEVTLVLAWANICDMDTYLKLPEVEA